MRYDSQEILIDNNTGKRYLKALKYPAIPVSVDDIYIITQFGDTLDFLSYEYYNNVDDYWILAIANGMDGSSRFVKPGTQFRIPSDIVEVKRLFNEINGKV